MAGQKEDRMLLRDLTPPPPHVQTTEQGSRSDKGKSMDSHHVAPNLKNLDQFRVLKGINQQLLLVKAKDTYNDISLLVMFRYIKQCSMMTAFGMKYLEVGRMLEARFEEKVNRDCANEMKCWHSDFFVESKKVEDQLVAAKE
ncbi:unnamed protein product [Lupinus luteus]|uniref:Uncharacterized protein n=1 Tax=Lupinus luteus TaxID=3873 RepID=A0AAV1XIF9_LUPLU